ncbi:hypothetical protein BSKO_06141 [Bryopsis sp. KO-2023]|nr:hypothetical protein BSKO_06141 [Bryopsis sp. KO-2023]
MPDVVTRAMLEMAENDEPEVVCTKQSTVHPKYREQYFPDLAILELCEEIPGSKEIELPPSRESKLGFSEPAILIGWGRISRRSANPAKLQDIRVSFLPLAVCRKMFRQRVRSGQLCFEGGEQGTCAGDAGSPLINQNDGRETLAGIVTSVNPCGDRAKPELHIQVAPYLDWIKDITGKI